MKTVGATTGTSDVTALISNAALATNAIDAPMATPVTTTVDNQPAQDSYEAGAERADKPSNSQLDADRASDTNPFEELPRGDADDVRLSEHEVDLQSQIDTKQTQLARLNAALLALSREGKELPTSLLEGFMMLTHDNQAAEQPLSQQMQRSVEQYAAKIASNEATEADHKVFWAQAEVGEHNVMAFVNRVLRESYLLQNGVMADMAGQLKQTNELRKLIRGELNKARTTQAEWATQAKGDDKWSSSTPYGAMRVNTNLGTLELDTMDPDALARHEATIQAQQQADADDQKIDAAQVLAALTAPSKLTDKQRFQLGVLSGGNDETVKHAMDDLIGAIPSMNADDLRKYLEPALQQLTNGNTDEDEIFKIFKALNPAQMLQVVGDGFTEGKFGFKGKDAQTFRDLTASVMFDYLSQPSDTATPTSGAKVASRAGQVAASGLGAAIMFPAGSLGAALGFVVGAGDPTAKLNQLSAQNAKDLLGQLAAAAAAKADKDAAGPQNLDGAKVGDQRKINTSAEMDAYIQGLEDKINSIGDDAELQQVTLQDALQKNQQMIQMMSNLIKVIHDTAMAVIRNDNS
jgi:hypothetical protein